MTVLVAALASCGKEEMSVNNGCLSIVAERMDGGNKVLVDPTAPNGASWVAGEQINLNGSPYSIDSSNGQYFLSGVVPLSVDMYAIYPASLNTYGNNISVSNNGINGCAVDIHSLAVTLHADGKHDVVFPMAAHADAHGSSLLFKHLTGGLKLTISNTTAHSVTRIVVSAIQSDDSPAIYKNVVPSWAGATLPALPEGEVGTLGFIESALFVSDMNLALNSTNNSGNITSGFTIEAGSSVTFCIPMLAKELKHLTITGYNGDSQVFSKTKTLNNAIDVERNKMYDIPEIAID